MTALLDTHILLYWVSQPDLLSPAQRHVLLSAGEESPLLLSDISLWEIATLASLKRVVLDRPLREWLERAAAPPLVRRIGISPAIAAEVANLPDTFHRDLADRLIVASARVMAATLITNDKRIKTAGIVETL